MSDQLPIDAFEYAVLIASEQTHISHVIQDEWLGHSTDPNNISVLCSVWIGTMGILPLRVTPFPPPKFISNLLLTNG